MQRDLARKITLMSELDFILIDYCRWKIFINLSIKIIHGSFIYEDLPIQPRVPRYSEEELSQLTLVKLKELCRRDNVSGFSGKNKHKRALIE